MVVEHICYNRVVGEYDAAEIFTEDMPESLVRGYYLRRREGVQDWTVLDSDTERKFAQDLEDSSGSMRALRTCRVRLPFLLLWENTRPTGAIAFNEGVVKHILLVPETKGSMQTCEL